MKVRIVLCLMMCALPALGQKPEPERPAGGVVDFRLPILADPVMQHAKETFILYGCAYCHGVDLKVRNGEAADLLHSQIVGADVDANLIGKVLKNGIPQTAKLSPMPQFSDLSDHEIADLARWIHYSRQQEKLKELAGVKASGDASAGKSFFEGRCATCHSQQDAVSLSKKYDAAQLKQRVLNPAVLTETTSYKVPMDAKRAKARQEHGSLLENYSESDLGNLLAYLGSLK